MTVSPRLPQGVPPEVLQSMVGRILGPDPSQTGPGPMPQPGQPPQGPPQPQMPGQQGQQPPDAPPGTGSEGGEGISPEIAEMLKGLMKDPKARDDLKKIIDAVGKKENDKSPLMVIDPVTKLQLAQAWNARIVGVGTELMGARSISPGASKASDEALLRVYYTTPKDLELEDIDEYADAIRLHLVANGMTDIGQIEDQVMRWCFPLRETLIRSAGRLDSERVDFVRAMSKLTDKWLDKYGSLPEPDWKVIKATEKGKGDPESEIDDEDSSDLAGEV